MSKHMLVVNMSSDGSKISSVFIDGVKQLCIEPLKIKQYLAVKGYRLEAKTQYSAVFVADDVASAQTPTAQHVDPPRKGRKPMSQWNWNWKLIPDKKVVLPGETKERSVYVRLADNTLCTRHKASSGKFYHKALKMVR